MVEQPVSGRAAGRSRMTSDKRRMDAIDRRCFMAALGGSLVSVQPGDPLVTRPFALSGLIRSNDRLIPDFLSRQEMDRAHPWFGGVKDQFDIHSAPATTGFIRTLGASVLNPGSNYFGDSSLIRRLEEALRYLLMVQHEDGTIDLHTTNFNSPPDTAFVVEPLAALLTLLASSQDQGLAEVRGLLERFLRRTGQALVSGGIHTPNHRWVVCSALARLFEHFGQPEYISRIDEWLSEGIDLNSDGQFSERSTSIYSPTCDWALITVARILRRTELLDPVRRNLEMTLYLVHPSGEVVTQTSLRQDRGLRGSLRRFHLPYRYMARRDDNRRFATMARWIEELEQENLAGDLLFLMEDPFLAGELPPSAPVAENFVRLFRDSGILRIRRGEVSASVFSQSTTFLSLHRGEAVLEAVRMASAFFGKGQFKAEEIGGDGPPYLLVQRLEGPYYQPLPPEERTGDGMRSAALRRLRPQSEIQWLDSTVAVTERDGNLSLAFEVVGTPGVPLAIELAFRRGGQLLGVEAVPGIPDAYFLNSEVGVYRLGGSTIRFGPALHRHGWTQLRGAEPRIDALSVYLTTFTPFRFVLRLTG